MRRVRPAVVQGTYRGNASFPGAYYTSDVASNLMTPSETPVRVLFVCLGNICRSPLAAAIFAAQARERGVANRFVVDSAGTSDVHAGEPPDPRARAEAARLGVALGGRARAVTPEDLRRFDWILAMDRSNLAALEALQRRYGGRARLALLRDLDPLAGPAERDVPDPYWGGPEGFAEVTAVLQRCCAAWLDRLLEAAAPAAERA